MKKIFIFFIFLCIFPSCSHYNEIEAGITLEIPNPLIPISFGINLKLKDRIPESKEDEDNIINQLIGERIIDKWMHDSDSTERGGDNGKPEKDNGDSGKTS